MFTALDKNGSRISIDEASRDGDYFCEACGEKLVLKNGKIRAPHFSHKKGTLCTDDWDNEMSFWHLCWQKKFSFEQREIVKNYRNKKHRADVLIDDIKTVIEFQHSPLSSEEFTERNNFFNALGYKVVWVFDVVEKYENGYIEFLYKNDYGHNIYSWSRRGKTFDHYYINNQVEIFLQIENKAEDNEKLQRCLHGNIQPSLCVGAHISEHKNDKGRLIKVTWISNKGFYRFAAEKECSVDEFEKNFQQMENKEKKVIQNINPVKTTSDYCVTENPDSIINIWKKHKITVGVFKNIQSHFYVKINIDPELQLREYKKVRGVFSTSKKNFNNSLKEIYDYYKPVWVLVYLF